MESVIPENLVFPSPLSKSAKLQDILDRPESFRLQMDKEVEFPFNEEQIFKDSFSNSPFIVSTQTPHFEKKLSQLMNQCQTPKRSNLGNANSIIAQHTPVNPWTQYLAPGDAPSPARFLKVGENKHSFPTFPKSILGTPEIFQSRNNRRGINLQKLIFSGLKEPRNELFSSSKKHRRDAFGKNEDAKENWKEALGLNSKKLWMTSPARENKENGFATIGQAEDIRSKVRSSEIQYENDFLGDAVSGSLARALKSGPVGIQNPNQIFRSDLMKTLGPKFKFSPRKEKHSLMQLGDCVKPKKLFETKKLASGGDERNMLGNLQDFFEKSLSKILETTPRNAKTSQGVGMLFFNAINSIRADSKGKTVLANKFNSRNSSERNRFLNKKYNFGAGKKEREKRSNGQIRPVLH